MAPSVVRISVVTTTYNRRHLLERAILSAMGQSCQAFEHIIIDAASTDGTLEMLARYPHLRVLSEPDKNLYEGWNKGLKLAGGDYVCILNSDDELPAGALEEVNRIANLSSDAEMISGAVEIMRNVDQPGANCVVIDDPRMIGLREQDVGPGIPLTNGRYLSRRLLDRIGPFDERYSVISDRQFFLRTLVGRARNVTTSATLYRYHVHEGSFTLNDFEPSEQLTQQCLDAACDGLNEAETAEGLMAYRRWHAWCVFYLAGLQARAARFRDASRTCLRAFGVDPAWIFRLPVMLLRHILERGARKGRRVGSFE